MGMAVFQRKHDVRVRLHNAWPTEDLILRGPPQAALEGWPLGWQLGALTPHLEPAPAVARPGKPFLFPNRQSPVRYTAGAESDCQIRIDLGGLTPAVGFGLDGGPGLLAPVHR